MRLLVVLFLGLSLFRVDLAQSHKPNPIPAGWKEVIACGLKFNIPDTLKQTKNKGIDSCVVGFTSDSMWITIDAGIYGNRLEKADWALNFVKERIIVDGKQGEFATYKDSTTFQNGDFIAAMYVVRGTGFWGNHIPYKDSVNMSIGSKNVKDLNIAKRVFKSLRFE